MGGLLILLAFTISTILWAKLNNVYIWIIWGVAIFGLIGLLDDWLKVSRMSSNVPKLSKNFASDYCCILSCLVYS